jgi:hypothetical protein
MTTQPDALRLADYLTDRNRLDLTCDEAAAELRRLVAQRDALLKALRWIATVNAMDYEYQNIARTAMALEAQP